ncbi:MAG TPA: serine/threonine-protein kinase [Polyangiaceae bacterium]|jgi:serine/threonine-protein kinase
MDDGPVIGGKYRLRNLIGAGGMGQVWVGRNEVTEREFAIKLLLPQAAANAEVVSRFVQEAKVSGRLRHPGILEIYDVGTAPELQGAPFLVMELLHGVSLDAAIRSLGALPLRFTLLVAIAIARALRAAHDNGVVHRDLKPANVFLHRDGSGVIVPKLLDFGISKLGAIEGDDDSGLGLTRTGAILGSPRFMSPEQLASQKDIDGRSDLHALGVLVWWCLVGRSPFVGAGLRELMLEILSDKRPRLSDAMIDVPPGVNELVTRAFAGNREDRYPNAGAALAALEAELAKLGPGPTLESGTWQEDLLSKVAPARLPAASLPMMPPLALAPPGAPDGRETTTHGAVSVSVEGGAAASSQPSSYGAGTPTPAPEPRRSRLVAAGIGGVVVLLLLALVVTSGLLYGRTKNEPRAASDGDAPGSAAAALVLPSAPRPAEEAVAVAAPVVTAQGSPAIELDAGAVSPRAAVGAASTARAPRVLPSAGRAPARAPARGAGADNDPFHGVTGTGL